MGMQAMSTALPARRALTSWCVTAQVRADHLRDEIVALPLTTDATALAAVAAATQAVQYAEDVIDDSQNGSAFRRFWDGVTGSRVEYVWQQLHLAEEQLVFAQPETTLIAQMPTYNDLAVKVYSGNHAAKAVGAIRSWKRPIEPADRQLAHDIRFDSHGASDKDHHQVRNLRNVLYALSAIVTVLVVVLWWLDLATAPVLWLGALGGAVSVVFAFNKAGPSTPYNLITPQMLLKIVAGAATAALAVKIMDASVVPGLSVPAAQMYAVLFGFSQQAFTQLADKRVAALKTALD